MLVLTLCRTVSWGAVGDKRPHLKPAFTYHFRRILTALVAVFISGVTAMAETKDQAIAGIIEDVAKLNVADVVKWH